MIKERELYIYNFCFKKQNPYTLYIHIGVEINLEGYSPVNNSNIYTVGREKRQFTFTIETYMMLKFFYIYNKHVLLESIF